MTYKKKRKIFFYSILASGLIAILLITATFLINAISPSVKTALFVIILIILVVVLLTLKSKFEYYNFVTKYHLLIENGNDPKESNIKIGSPAWFKKLEENNFVIYRDFTKFKMYYRFDQVTSKNKRSKAAVLIVEIVEDITFENQEIVHAVNQFEDDFMKKEKFRNHIVLQFKNTSDFNQENIETTQNISFIKPVKNHYVIIINCLYSVSEKQAFFVNSDTHSPNHYYTYAADIVNKLV